MNYLREITAFNKMAEINGLSVSERVLWYALMDINNSLGWPKTFTVAVLTLQSKTGLNEREVYRARNRMVQRGLITVTTRGSNRAASYTIKSICDTSELSGTLSDTLSGNLSGTLSDTLSGSMSDSMSGTLSALNKLNKTKLNKTKHNTPLNPLFDRFWEAYPKKVAKEVARKAFEKVNPDEVLLAAILKAIEAQKRTTQWTKDNGEFIPHPSTWLNQARWEDESPTEPVEVVDWAVEL